MFHETVAATADMVVLPGVLEPRILRRTIQVRLGSESLRLPGGTHIFMISQHRFVKHAGSQCNPTEWSQDSPLLPDGKRTVSSRLIQHQKPDPSPRSGTQPV